MSKASAAINAVTDTTVQSSIGNVILNSNEGWVGMLLNGAAAVGCAVLRGLAEIRKDISSSPPTENLEVAEVHYSRLQALRTDLTLPIAVNGLAQLGIVVLKLCSHSPHHFKDLYDGASDIRIPLFLTAGNFIASGSVIRTLFKGAARTTTAAVKTVKNSARFIFDHIVCKPNTYWAGAVIVTSHEWPVKALFLGIIGFQLTQALWQARPGASGKTGRWVRLMKSTQAPNIIQGSVCCLTSAVFLYTTHPLREVFALGFYGVSYFTYAAQQNSQGVVEWAQAMRSNRRQNAKTVAATGPQ